MHTCRHAYMHTCIHADIRTYIYAHIHTYVRTYVPTYIHIHTYVRTYVRAYVCRYMIYMSQNLGRNIYIYNIYKPQDVADIAVHYRMDLKLKWRCLEITRWAPTSSLCFFADFLFPRIREAKPGVGISLRECDSIRACRWQHSSISFKLQHLLELRCPSSHAGCRLPSLEQSSRQSISCTLQYLMLDGQLMNTHVFANF